uniref:Uncharacterized protein n=1 Tax=viral metagenome TaxID=1070528 RepID=A0A6M3K625_9ZZZZ
MAEISIEDVRKFLTDMQGQVITLKELRSELNILPGTNSFDSIRVMMLRLTEQKILRYLGRNGGYKVIQQVSPIKVFGSKRSEPIEIKFPVDRDTEMEMSFAGDIILREGDLILISGRSNFGKTTLCMNFAAENIASNPVLMGNEYTTLDSKPSSRFLHRLDAMNWVQWYDDDGDRFTLLPVRGDYAEHIIKDRMNIIDWVNIETGEHYMIGTIMEAIKREVGKGVSIIAIQKAENAESGRGGQFTKDFADVEILLDQFGDEGEILLTIGKVKEAKRRLMGRTYAYQILNGVGIHNFREVVKCTACYGKKWRKVGNTSIPCDVCFKTGFRDR